MGRYSRDDPTTTVLHSSSTALLQERFKQLQRVKEMRKERELLGLSAEAQRPNPANRCEQSEWFLHPDLIHPSRSLHSSSSLRVHSYNGSEDFHVCETSLSIGLWPNQANINVHALKKSTVTDVDTSLHL